MKSILFFLLFLSLNAFCQVDAEAKKLLRKIDELYRSEASVSKVEMEVVTPHWSRTMKMDMWTKGLDYTFVRIKSPRKDRGVSTLKRKNEMWNFFPKINKVIKIPPSMMMGSWMGSDFTNDDLVKDSTLEEDYNIQVQQNDKKLAILSLTPKKDTVSLWGKILVHIDKIALLPLKQEFYDEKGTLIRIMSFKDVKTMGGKTLPTVMELIPKTKNKKGHKTVVRYIELSFPKKISKSIFTRTNLQKRR